jgi:hypothetical protein
MQINKSEQDIDNKEVKDKPFVAWEAQERVRPPWVQEKHGETIAPPMEQKSNVKLMDEQVLQSRTQPIVSGSQATPIDGRHDRNSGASDEPSGSKRNYPDSGGIPL